MRLPDQGPQAVDWDAIDKVLCKPAMNGGFGFTLEQCYKLTFPEIEFYLGILTDKPGQPSEGTPLATSGPEAMQQQMEYVQWWRSLTPKDKIERALARRR